MRKSRAVRLGAVTLAAATVLAACSGGGDTSGSPASSRAATTTGSPGGAAPQVPAPLNIVQVKTDACKALSAQQIDQIGLVGPGKPTSISIGPGCTWASQAYATNVAGIGLVTANQLGLNNIYNKKDQYKGYFEPTTVEGYPAVYAAQTDGRSTGECLLWFGLTDQDYALVETGIGAGPNRSNPCPVADRIATAVIEHLKGAA